MNDSKRMGFCEVPGHDDEPDEIRSVPVEIVEVTLTGSTSSVDVCLIHEAGLRKLGLIG